MTNDLQERVARANPIPRPPTVPDVDLLRAILDSSDGAARRRPRPRLRLLVGTGAAAVAAVALVVTLLPGERLGPSPAAAQALERLASASAAQPTPAGRWAYTKVRTVYGATNVDQPPYTVLLPSVRESWVAADGGARVVESSGAPIFLSERDRRRWQESGGRMKPGPTTDQRFESLPPFYADAVGLSTDPDRLEAELRRWVETHNPSSAEGYPIEGELRDRISSLLHSPAASAELRAALYRVLARLPGVELVGDVRDSTGRVGVGLKTPGGYSDVDEPTSRLLIVDPETGELLAEETVIERRVDWIDADPGTVLGEIVYLEHGWTDSVQERP